MKIYEVTKMIGGRPVNLVVDNRLLELIAKDIEQLSSFHGFDDFMGAAAAAIVRSYKTVDTPHRTVDV